MSVCGCMQVYGWPFGLTRKWQAAIKPLETRWNGFWSSLCARCAARRQKGSALTHV